MKIIFLLLISEHFDTGVETVHLRMVSELAAEEEKNTTGKIKLKKHLHV